MSYLQDQLQLALGLYNQGELSKASSILFNTMPDVAACGQILKLIANMQLQQGNRELSKALFERALAIAPDDASILGQLSSLEIIDQNEPEARAYYERACQLDEHSPALEDLHRIFSNRRMPIGQSMLINTLPKSGSLFLWHAMYTGLDLPQARLGSDWYLVERLVKDAVKRGAVGHGHFHASRDNLLTLHQVGVKKMILHLRDPRAALLSWVSQLDTLQAQGKSQPLFYELIDGYFSLSFEDQKECPAYFSLSFEEKLSAQIERYLPWQVHWIQDWLAVADGSGSDLEILVTHYSQLLENPRKFYRKILDFYGLAYEGFRMVNDLSQQGQPSDDTAWQQHFTPNQLDRMSDLLGSSLKTRMQWI